MDYILDNAKLMPKEPPNYAFDRTENPVVRTTTKTEKLFSNSCMQH